mmetsp:Transcript_35547/g.89307  ORF Transcript_35547/g.89307 Transcript_35547/m.89307 type:complete len:519 (-) Transcript_35547:95-1651(-)|eukprot:CAMPEP_0177667816 /NCGR_PEP_ID=MMETSP0447-20121125/22346_1 /TAXON_ID=0 /ORGANISM="Stygamoeba regulata, Strain BSH-02190019" /LENGTH=518 /DNA_ID=CAMNT_0019174115 /DNA_START=81 /DNA_END=1637 /DNA_ORIENTATION=+
MSPHRVFLVVLSVLALAFLCATPAQAQNCAAFESVSALQNLVAPLFDACGVNVDAGTVDPTDPIECCNEVANFLEAFADCETVAESNSVIAALVESYSTLVRAVCNTDFDPDSWVQTCPVNSIDAQEVYQSYLSAASACAHGDGSQSNSCSADCIEKSSLFFEELIDCFGEVDGLPDVANALRGALTSSCSFVDAARQCHSRFEEVKTELSEACAARTLSGLVDHCEAECSDAMQHAAEVAAECNLPGLVSQAEFLALICTECAQQAADLFAEARDACDNASGLCGPDCSDAIDNFQEHVQSCDNGALSSLLDFQIDTATLRSYCDVSTIGQGDCIDEVGEKARLAHTACLAGHCNQECREAIRALADARGDCTLTDLPEFDGVADALDQVCELGSDRIVRIVIQDSVANVRRTIEAWKDYLASLGRISRDRIFLIFIGSNGGTRQSATAVEFQIANEGGAGQSAAAAANAIANANLIGALSADEVNVGAGASAGSSLSAASASVLGAVVFMLAVLFF